MNGKEALTEMVKSTLKYNDNLIDKVANLSNIVLKDLDMLEKLEKELVQTKKNFKNSRTHSKNCYKKLKGKYNEVDYCYKKLSKDHISLKKGFDELFEVYIRKTRELEQLEKDGQVLMNKTLEISNKLTKYKKVVNILKENLFIEFRQNGDYLMVLLKEDKEQECDYTIMFLDNKEEFNLLKEVLGNA